MKAVLNLLESKPYLGYLASAGGLVSWLMTLVKVLTPILGFAGALFGAAAGFLTLLIKWREWRAKKQ